MTDGAARVLSDASGVGQAREVLEHLISRNPGEAWTSGQWMTERQGGSDVGQNAVVAKRDGDRWRLFGQKFFCSNIGCEVALALARPEGAAPGLALSGPRKRARDGTRNRYRIGRLRENLGPRAMAPGGAPVGGAPAELAGAGERAFAKIPPLLNIPRLQNAITAAGIMRRA